MKNFYVLLLFLAPYLLLAQTSKSKKFNQLYSKPIERKYYVKERYYKGNLYVEGEAIQKVFSKKKRVELKRGPWKWYHRNGQLKDSVFYTDAGLPTGVETLYNSDGTIHQTIDYGTSTNFIIRERNWLTTIAKDYTRTYYYKAPNIPKKTQVYKNRKKDGVWKTYDTNGKVISEKSYSKGKLITNP
ncbi:MAG TPA: hypothetical protein PLN13_09150 [Bacteroidia bacterium]|nr:hypothetical protein [Bacteroidia bacterium]HRH08734.1 hypothetical protein [Bacteroidia bacterium]